jgi:hypothetical protein
MADTLRMRECRRNMWREVGRWSEDREMEKWRGREEIEVQGGGQNERNTGWGDDVRKWKKIMEYGDGDMWSEPVFGWDTKLQRCGSWSVGR